MAKNFLKITKSTQPEIQEARRTSISINTLKKKKNYIQAYYVLIAENERQRDNSTRSQMEKNKLSI